MMRALYVQGLRRIVSRPILMSVLAVLLVEPVALQALMSESRPMLSNNVFLLGLLACAGTIGGDFSRGEIRLILARPVPRSSYLLARWLSAGTVLGAAVLLQHGLACTVSATLGLDGALPWKRMLTTGISLATWGFLFSAVLLPLSTLLPAEADACVYGVVALGLVVTEELLHHPPTARIVGEVRDAITPDPTWLLDGVHAAIFAASNAAVALLLACVILTWRELPSAPPA